jgi:hypothetical protein
MDCMPEQNRPADGCGHDAFHLLAWIPVLLALYVLSTGPLVKVAVQANSPRLHTILFTVYAPLGALADRSQVTEDFFEWYLGKVWHAF